jgi:hypothetical protein
MNLLGKRTSQIIADDIERLIVNQIKENKSLDYKRELKLDDKDKREFLFDIASFYNTDGGYLIYGIEELKDKEGKNTGIPKKILGIPIENEDKLFQKIEDITRTNTEPSICSLELKCITIQDKIVLIIGIPKNIGLPCMVTLNETYKFHKRKNTGKYAVDVYELNQMFIRNIMISEYVEKFRMKRIKSTRDNFGYYNVDDSTIFLADIIPFSSINENILDLSSIRNRFKNILIDMMPILANGWDYMYNISGFATFALGGNSYQTDFPAPNKIVSYNQIFRNGIYEIFTSRLIEPYEINPRLQDSNFVKIIDQINSGLKVLNGLGIESPFYICLSFKGLQNCHLGYNSNSLSNMRFKTNEVFLPSILIQSYDTDIKQALIPIFDILYQAVGLNKSSF